MTCSGLQSESPGQAAKRQLGRPGGYKPRLCPVVWVRLSAPTQGGRQLLGCGHLEASPGHRGGGRPSRLRHPFLVPRACSFLPSPLDRCVRVCYSWGHRTSTVDRATQARPGAGGRRWTRHTETARRKALAPLYAQRLPGRLPLPLRSLAPGNLPGCLEEPPAVFRSCRCSLLAGPTRWLSSVFLTACSPSKSPVPVLASRTLAGREAPYRFPAS